MRASVLLDRSDSTLPDPLPVAVHAERVIGRWNPMTVSWSTAPPQEDVRLPRTVVAPANRSPVRVDVTELVRRWLARDPADQGLSIVAENQTLTGVTFALKDARRLLKSTEQSTLTRAPLNLPASRSTCARRHGVLSIRGKGKP